MIAVDSNNRELAKNEIFMEVMHASRTFNETANLNIEKEMLEKQRDTIQSLMHSSHSNLNTALYKLEDEALQHRLYLCETKLQISKLFFTRCETIIKLFSSVLVDPIIKEDLFAVLVEEAYLKNQYLLNAERAKIHVHNRCKEFLDILCKEGFTSRNSQSDSEKKNAYPSKEISNSERYIQTLASEVEKKFLTGEQPVDELVTELKTQLISMRLDDKQRRECNIFISILTGSNKEEQDTNENEPIIDLPIKLLNNNERIMHSNKVDDYKQFSENLKGFVSTITPEILNLDVITLNTLLNSDSLKVLEELNRIKTNSISTVYQEEETPSFTR